MWLLARNNLGTYSTKVNLKNVCSHNIWNLQRIHKIKHSISQHTINCLLQQCTNMYLWWTGIPALLQILQSQPQTLSHYLLWCCWEWTQYNWYNEVQWCTHSIYHERDWAALMTLEITFSKNQFSVNNLCYLQILWSAEKQFHHEVPTPKWYTYAQVLKCQIFCRSWYHLNQRSDYNSAMCTAEGDTWNIGCLNVLVLRRRE